MNCSTHCSEQSSGMAAAFGMHETGNGSTVQLYRLLELTPCSHSISYNMQACPIEEEYVTTMTISVLMEREGTQPRMGWQLFSCLKVVLQALVM